MTLLELTLETAIKEAGEFKNVRLLKEDAECVLARLKDQEAERLDFIEAVAKLTAENELLKDRVKNLLYYREKDQGVQTRPEGS